MPSVVPVEEGGGYFSNQYALPISLYIVVAVARCQRRAVVRLATFGIESVRMDCDLAQHVLTVGLDKRDRVPAGRLDVARTPA